MKPFPNAESAGGCVEGYHIIISYVYFVCTYLSHPPPIHTPPRADCQPQVHTSAWCKCVHTACFNM
ncbi:hypothetical protein T492DRAFT_1108133 [Pavlovales sp. CCMP2436]|nr:hypothetical protein T492DRAFT_1108133 [Pavlovales sp. CCMP2436]